MSFSEDDLAVLRARGIVPAEAERQLAMLRDPPPCRVLVRPCTVGDGIERLTSARRLALAALAARASRDGRCERFVPASGAATRMFHALLSVHGRPPLLEPGALDAAAAEGDADARSARDTLASIDRFAFRDALVAELSRRGEDLTALLAAGRIAPVLDALLTREGLGLAALPKGLLAFHAPADGPRTAFDEQLHEAAQLGREANGRVRAHFTVSPEHDGGFAAQLARVRPMIEGTYDAQLEVGFSHQHPSTDTIAIDAYGVPVRSGGAPGRLLLRPAGHGALIENFAALGGDLVFIKNIDNVQPEHRRGPTLDAARAVFGRLVELQGATHAALRRLEDSPDEGALAAADKVWREFTGEPAADADADERPQAVSAAQWRERLHRPIRVCGMVPNSGEPGGGPFWVRDSAGSVRQQIVESAEVDMEALGQRAVFAAGTHFNPVFLACALRDHHRAAFPLERFVDPRAVIVTRKSAGGHPLVALERPGLWNGAMARWLTVFVEVSLTVFTPVKHINDLLRPEHQA